MSYSIFGTTPTSNLMSVAEAASKVMGLEEVEVAEAKGTAYPATIDTLKMIVKEKQNQTVMFKSGQAIVDLFTASAMVQVYDAMKPATKKKFEDMIKDKGGFMKTQAFAMKMMEDTRWNDRTLELDEAFFKVSIPDVAPTFVEADSASKVKANMRKILKPDVVKELEIERVTPAGMKKMYRDMAKGKEEIDEAVLIDRDYEYDGKVIKISKKNFSKVHRDFKGTTKGKETMLTYDDKEGTVLVPVEFTEDVEITEAVHDKKSTFTMAPFEDLRSVADAALQVMTRNKQEVKEEEVIKEEPPQKLTEEIV